MISQSGIINGLRELGLLDNDAVLVHSNCRSIGPIEGGPPSVVSALESTVGPYGTIVAPTFTFDRPGGPSEMGVLTRLVDDDFRARHIPHPTHSFAVLGFMSPIWGEIRNVSAYGPDSLFAALTEYNGKILIVGLDWQNSMTYFHYVEQTIGVDYREVQPVRADPAYTIYARRSGVVTSVNGMGALLDESGIVRVHKIGNAMCRLMRAREVFAFVASRIADAKGLLYETE